LFLEARINQIKSTKRVNFLLDELEESLWI
jgi:hypothetical protein